MTTDAILYPGPLLLGVDGNRPSHNLSSDECCPDPLCVPFCSTACSFIDILPTGPMWDRQKIEATARLQEGGDYDPCAIPVCIAVEDCPSMVSYAVYGARVLHDMISNILWPSIREVNPATAVTTLDDWLDRMGWEDCYRQHCRSLFISELSPYVFEDGCGPAYCEQNFPLDFECALKYNILQALTRASRGVIKNLDGLNWIIAPLGAVVRPLTPYPDYVQNYLDGNCEEEDEGPPCYCEETTLEICNVGMTLAACPSPNEQCGKTTRTVAAVQRYTCGPEIDVMLFPAVIAAECIVRSILNKKCPNIIFRCAGIVTP